MSIHVEAKINPLAQDEFHALDRIVMRQAFDIHNSLGRFCDEEIYQSELARRCEAQGVTARRETRVTIFFESFTKSYYLDLLLNAGAVYELKAVKALSTTHEKQLIHYLLLTGIQHGKLINFRPGSVESRFVSSQLTLNDRIPIKYDLLAWDGSDPLSELLYQTLRAILTDWGAFLDISLYKEALLHFLEKQDARVELIECIVGNQVVGKQHMSLLTPDTAWHISSIRRHVQSYKTHLARLLNHTHLTRMQWINMNQKHVTLTTIKK